MENDEMCIKKQKKKKCKCKYKNAFVKSSLTSTTLVKLYDLAIDQTHLYFVSIKTLITSMTEISKHNCSASIKYSFNTFIC